MADTYPPKPRVLRTMLVCERHARDINERTIAKAHDDYTGWMEYFTDPITPMAYGIATCETQMHPFACEGRVFRWDVVRTDTGPYVREYWRKQRIAEGKG